MNYTGKELSAVVKMAITMAAADGKFADEERTAIIFELANFGVSSDQAVQILERSRDMDASEALATIHAMNKEQKKYVTGYLAVIMVSDGEIAESEIKIWQLVSMLADLPTMSVSEALDFWSNH